MYFGSTRHAETSLATLDPLHRRLAEIAGGFAKILRTKLR
jgi:hypothetical protein